MSRSRLLIPLLCALAFAPPAFAQQDEDGVFVDPDAPTSKEYAIPLEDARRDAAGGDKRLGRQAQGERSAPLFGEGVGDESGSESAPAAAGGGDSGGDDEGGKGEDGGSSPARSGGGDSETESAPKPAAPAPAGSDREPAPTRAEAPDGGIGAGVTIGALALSVLLLGGVIGSIARRRGGGAPA